MSRAVSLLGVRRPPEDPRPTGPFGGGSPRDPLGLMAGSSVMVDNDVMGEPGRRGSAEGRVRVYLTEWSVPPDRAVFAAR
jgi:hypothetical protein